MIPKGIPNWAITDGIVDGGRLGRKGLSTAFSDRMRNEEDRKGPVWDALIWAAVRWIGSFYTNLYKF